MKQSLGERWVRWAGYWAVRQQFLVAIILLFAVLYLLLAFITHSFMDAIVPNWLLWTVFWALFALVQYERAQFYKIIQNLEHQVGELQGQAGSAALVDES